MQQIGEKAFYNLKNLASIDFGSSVKTIGKGAFKNCDALTSLDFPDSLITIESDAFKLAVKPYIKTANGNIWSTYSVITTATAPAAPTKIVTASNSSAIKLTWNKVSGATGYRIYYKTSANASWKVAVKATAQTTQTFKNLPSSKTYIFAVRPYIITDSVIWGNYKQATAKTK